MSETDRGDDFAPAEEELDVNTPAAEDPPPPRRPTRGTT